MKKSRFFMLHPECNQGKIASLEALHFEYVAYVRICVQRMFDYKILTMPNITKPSEVSKGILARKTKNGRWRFEFVEKKEYLVLEPEPSLPRLGVDVGLNVIAATSDGRLLGSNVKPKFDELYEKVKKLRANRQRQNLKENSPRLDRLESKLSSLTKTATGQAANRLVKAYPNTVFVIEDLDLSGCKGQKRFCYRALAHSLESKAPTEKVNPAYTSQTCPSCGHVHRSNRSGTNFLCRNCGRASHADVVGGINLLRRSEDKQISLVDNPSDVKEKLVRLYWFRRNPDQDCPQDFLNKYAPLSFGRRLTTRASPLTGQAGIASNQVAFPSTKSDGEGS